MEFSRSKVNRAPARLFHPTVVMNPLLSAGPRRGEVVGYKASDW
jgi:hypothetical protein